MAPPGGSIAIRCFAVGGIDKPIADLVIADLSPNSDNLAGAFVPQQDRKRIDRNGHFSPDNMKIRTIGKTGRKSWLNTPWRGNPQSAQTMAPASLAVLAARIKGPGLWRGGTNMLAIETTAAHVSCWKARA